MILYRPGGLTLELSPELTYVLPNRETLHCFEGEPQRLPEKSLIEWAHAQVHPKDGSLLLDIGANIGTWSLYFASRGVRVHAWEPQQSTRAALLAGIALNGLTDLVTVHPEALHSSEGVMPLRVIHESGGSSSLCALPTNVWPKRTEQVRAMRLDDVDLVGSPGMIKIDVEGNELEVLRGAESSLEHWGWPKILFEAWVVDWYAEQKGKTLGWLIEHGYRVVQVMGYCEAFLAERAT